MRALERESERVSRFGGMTGDGMLKLLGTPAQDRLTTVVREAVQNSWDARIRNRNVKPKFSIRLRQLEDHQASGLNGLLADWPTPKLRSQFDEFLNRPVRKRLVLELSDFGTVGLNGPTQADVPTDDGPSNFVDFMRTFGTPRNEHLGGGTYGYGKSSLFRASRLGLLVVDSMHKVGGEFERRLMACMIGGSFDIRSGSKKGRYTGRHWWGRERRNCLEPAVGSEAGRISERLGFAPRSAGNTGTSILIVDVDVPENAELAVKSLKNVLLWNFWPKMLRDAPRGSRMEFQVECDGVAEVIPSPEDVPPFDLYASCMRTLRGEDVSRPYWEIRCERPVKKLGLLAIGDGPIRDDPMRTNEDDDAIGASVVNLTPCHHVALMRPAELVVKYLAGPALADTSREWAGVFVCSDEDEVEAAFAESEPPAHDDWCPDSIADRTRRSLVRVALRRVSEATKDFVASCNPPPEGGADISLGAAADSLGQLLLSGSGDGHGRSSTGTAERGRGARVGTRQAQRIAVDPPTLVRLEEEGDRRLMATFRVRVRGKIPVLTELSALPFVVMDDEVVESTSLPSGVIPPTVVGYFQPDTDHPIAVDRCIHRLVLERTKGEVDVRVSFGDDVALALQVKAEAIHAS